MPVNLNTKCLLTSNIYVYYIVYTHVDAEEYVCSVYLYYSLWA